MNKILFTLAFLLAGATVFGQTQKLPVQGKLFENNTPVNGTRNFLFSITAISWSQALSNVQVTEGLYAVELTVPSTLFATQNTHDLRIEVNGTLLSTVKIHAPIEKDPTVPANIKDGIAWNEISGKPATFDLDPANEIQNLQLAGNSLSISGGNTVQLPTSGGGGGGGPFDTLVVGAAEPTPVIAAQSLQVGTSNPTGLVTQSFVSAYSGRLLSIEVECADIDNLGAEIRVYEGPTITGQPIASNIFPASAFSAATAYQSFPPSQSNVTMTKNTTYIFEIKITGGQYIFRSNGNDPYPFGQSNLGTGIDLNFRVNVEALVGPAFKVDGNGNVGIGTDNPTSKLTVNGRIEDATGLVMPVGSIISWAGPAPNPPKGWLVCDGAVVSKAIYPDLFQVIDTSWGKGNDNATFRLPDLQGQFLRGYSGATNNDPDKAGRKNYDGNVVGSKVGSYQDHAFRRHDHGGGAHQHDFTGHNSTFSMNDQTGTNQHPLDGTKTRQTAYSSSIISFEGESDTETRPRNAAVLYIIKY